MNKTLKLVLFILFIFSSLAIVDYYSEPKSTSVIKTLMSKSTKGSLETDAFTVIRSQNTWALSLKINYFPQKIKSVSITYNDTFYGVFLLRDKIYLPFVASPTELIISSLDEEGNPIINESFILGEHNVFKTP
jgi:hypothetical protein